MDARGGTPLRGGPGGTPQLARDVVEPEARSVYSLTAYVLYLNGLVREDEVIDARTLPRVQMPNRNGCREKAEVNQRQ